MKLQEALSKSKSFIVTAAGCSECAKAMELLKSKKIQFVEYKSEQNKELVEDIKKNEKCSCGFPMIYINGKFIGNMEKLKECCSECASCDCNSNKACSKK